MRHLSVKPVAEEGRQWQVPGQCFQDTSLQGRILKVMLLTWIQLPALHKSLENPVWRQMRVFKPPPPRRPQHYRLETGNLGMLKLILGSWNSPTSAALLPGSCKFWHLQRLLREARQFRHFQI